MIKYDDLIGIPFANRGRDPDKGLDCYGLVKVIYNRQGIQLPEYSAEWNNAEKINSLINGARNTGPWEEINAGDIDKNVPCVIAIRLAAPPGMVNHTGVYIGNSKFIHTRERAGGVCIDRIDSPAWRRCIVGFYKYKGTE
jgi:cell wall-associated NlpC family hydrolase